MTESPARDVASWRPFLAQLRAHFDALDDVGSILLQDYAWHQSPALSRFEPSAAEKAEKLARALDALAASAAPLRGLALELPLPGCGIGELRHWASFLEDHGRFPLDTCDECQAQATHLSYTQQDCDDEELRRYEGPDRVFCGECAAKRDRAYRAALGLSGRVWIWTRIRFRQSTRSLAWWFGYTAPRTVRRVLAAVAGKPQCIWCEEQVPAPFACTRCGRRVRLCEACRERSSATRCTRCSVYPELAA